MFRTLVLLPVALFSGLAFAGDPPAAPAEAPAATEEPAAEAPADETKPADADAEAEAPEATPDFMTLDKDANKSIEAAEAKVVASLSAVFTTVDADKNGKLSQSEFDAWTEAKTVQ